MLEQSFITDPIDLFILSWSCNELHKRQDTYDYISFLLLFNLSYFVIIYYTFLYNSKYYIFFQFHQSISVLVSSSVYRGLQPRSGQIKD